MVMAASAVFLALLPLCDSSESIIDVSVGRAMTLVSTSAGSVAAHRLDNGKFLWTRRIANQPVRLIGVNGDSVAAAADGALLVLSHRGDDMWTTKYEVPRIAPAPGLWVVGTRTTIAAHRETDGIVEWRLAIDGPGYPLLPRSSEKRIAFGSDSQVSVADRFGRRVFRRGFSNGYVDGIAGFDRGQLIVSTSTTLMGLDPPHGNVAWSLPLSGGGSSSLMCGDALLIRSGPDDPTISLPELSIVDLRSHSRLWTSAKMWAPWVPKPRAACFGAIIAVVLVDVSAGKSNFTQALVAMDKASGSMKWRRHVGSDARVASSGLEGMVVLGEGSDIVAIDMATGQTRWNATLK